MLYERIKELVEERKITVAELERKLDFGQGTIGRWRTQSPSTKNVSKVADYFNVSTDYLLGRVDTRYVVEEPRAEYRIGRLSDRDVAKSLNAFLETLSADDETEANSHALLFDGEDLDDETRELLMNSIKNAYQTAKIIKKNKKN